MKKEKLNSFGNRFQPNDVMIRNGVFRCYQWSHSTDVSKSKIHSQKNRITKKNRIPAYFDRLQNRLNVLDPIIIHLELTCASLMCGPGFSSEFFFFFCVIMFGPQ